MEIDRVDVAEDLFECPKCGGGGGSTSASAGGGPAVRGGAGVPLLPGPVRRGEFLIPAGGRPYLHEMDGTP